VASPNLDNVYYWDDAGLHCVDDSSGKERWCNRIVDDAESLGDPRRTRIVEAGTSIYYLGKRRVYDLCADSGTVRSSMWVGSEGLGAIRPHDNGVLVPEVVITRDPKATSAKRGESMRETGEAKRPDIQVWEGAEVLGHAQQGLVWNGIDARRATWPIEPIQQNVNGVPITISSRGLRFGNRWYATPTPIERAGPEIPGHVLIRCKRPHSLDGDWFAIRPLC
jgi:hypothetical protein